jgi:hypothetical protein
MLLCSISVRLIKIYLLKFFKLFAKLFYEQILIFLKCDKIVYVPRQKSDFTGLAWFADARTCHTRLVNFHSSELVT